MSDRTKGNGFLAAMRQRAQRCGPFTPFALRALGAYVAFLVLFVAVDPVRHFMGFFFYGHNWRTVEPSFASAVVNYFLLTFAFAVITWWWPSLRGLFTKGMLLIGKTFKDATLSLIESSAPRPHVATFPNAVVTYRGAHGHWDGAKYAATDDKLRRILESHPNADLSPHEKALSIIIEDVQRRSHAAASQDPGIYI